MVKQIDKLLTSNITTSIKFEKLDYFNMFLRIFYV